MQSASRKKGKWKGTRHSSTTLSRRNDRRWRGKDPGRHERMDASGLKKRIYLDRLASINLEEGEWEWWLFKRQGRSKQMKEIDHTNKLGGYRMVRERKAGLVLNENANAICRKRKDEEDPGILPLGGILCVNSHGVRATSAHRKECCWNTLLACAKTRGKSSPSKKE